MSKAMTSIDAQLEEQKKQILERLKGLGGGSSMPRIKVKGRSFVLPDERKFTNTIQVVILDWAYHYNYYEDDYVEGGESFPDCYAVGLTPGQMQPSQKAPNIQNDGPCATCPMNEFGSAKNGKGKACQNRIALAVRVFEEGGQDNDMMFVSVSPTGLKHWGKYSRKLNEAGLVPAQVVTEISFDEDSTYPVLKFGASREGTKALRKDREVMHEYLRDIAEANRILLTEPEPPAEEE